MILICCAGNDLASSPDHVDKAVTNPYQMLKQFNGSQSAAFYAPIGNASRTPPAASPAEAVVKAPSSAMLHTTKTPASLTASEPEAVPLQDATNLQGRDDCKFPNVFTEAKTPGQIPGMQPKSCNSCVLKFGSSASDLGEQPQCATTHETGSLRNCLGSFCHMHTSYLLCSASLHCYDGNQKKQSLNRIMLCMPDGT